MVEQQPFKLMVEGSSPSGVTDAGWCNGSTPAFGAGNRGSNPCPAATNYSVRGEGTGRKRSPEGSGNPCPAASMRIKKRLPTSGVIILLIVALAVISFVFQAIYKGKLLENNKSVQKIDKWYEVAESKDYKIFSGSTKGNDITVVLDKSTDDLLVPNETCEIEIPTEEKNKSDVYFYNETVGINIIGPYKSIYYREGTDNIFYQGVLNAGCVSEEGEIRLFTNENTSEIFCEISIQYKHIGC